MWAIESRTWSSYVCSLLIKNQIIISNKHKSATLLWFNLRMEKTVSNLGFWVQWPSFFWLVGGQQLQHLLWSGRSKNQRSTKELYKFYIRRIFHLGFSLGENSTYEYVIDERLGLYTMRKNQITTRLSRRWWWIPMVKTDDREDRLWLRHAIQSTVSKLEIVISKAKNYKIQQHTK